MIYSIKDCIEYVHDAGKITEMLYADLLNELEDLYESKEAYEDLIYKDEEDDKDE